MNKHTYISPFGNILIEEEDGMLERVVFYEGEEVFTQTSKVIEECVQQLTAYFEGKRKSFDLPLKIKGSSFQKKVRNLVEGVPYGKTTSYKEIGLKLSKIGAIRAIGAAYGANRFHIIIPCHKVIGSDGSLTGYAGSLETKKKLLIHEGVLLKQTSLF